MGYKLLQNYIYKFVYYCARHDDIVHRVSPYLALAGYPALLGPLPLYFFLPIRYSFLPSLPRITRLRPEYLQCNNRRG